MKQFLRQLIFLLAVPALLCAQESKKSEPSFNLRDYMAVGDGLAEIRVPYYDDDGNLQAQLYGGYARLLENEVVDVTNLKIDVYEKGAVIMTIFAPQCFTAIEESDGKKSLQVYSDGDVLIEMDQMTIAGHGFRFSSERSRFEILSDSRVLVKAAAREMKGVEL